MLCCSLSRYTIRYSLFPLDTHRKSNVLSLAESATSGTYLMTGLSESSIPRSTKIPAIAPVRDLLTENRICGVIPIITLAILFSDKPPALEHDQLPGGSCIENFRKLSLLPVLIFKKWNTAIRPDNPPLH